MDEHSGADGSPKSQAPRVLVPDPPAAAAGEDPTAHVSPGPVQLAAVEGGAGREEEGGGEEEGPPADAASESEEEEDAQDEPGADEESGDPSAEEFPPEVTAENEVHGPAADVVVLGLEQLSDDVGFRLRDEGDVTALATDLARLGQLFPIDVRPLGPDRYQVVCGFRRVAALQFLQRDKVVARVHASLSDEDALLMALAATIHAQPLSRDELAALLASLDEQGRLGAAARDMFDKALSSGDELAPEMVEEEVDADELAVDATARLGEINQDLALLAEVFSSLDEERRDELLKQLRYSAELVKFLEGQ